MLFNTPKDSNASLKRHKDAPPSGGLGLGRAFFTLILAECSLCVTQSCSAHSLQFVSLRVLCMLVAGWPWQLVHIAMTAFARRLAGAMLGDMGLWLCIFAWHLQHLMMIDDDVKILVKVTKSPKHHEQNTTFCLGNWSFDVL